jgi:bla regulator protein BlaR1
MNAWLQLFATNILVAGLIGCLAWRVGRSGRRAALAHLLWIAFFVKLITPPIVLLPVSVPESWLPATATSITGSFPYRRLALRSGEIAPSVTASPSAQPRVFTTSDFDASTGFLMPSLDLLTCLSLVWFAGFAFILVRGLLRFIRFRRLLASEGEQDEEASQFVHGLVRSHGQRGQRPCFSPKVLRVPIRVSPMLFGFGFRPAIVCPDPLWQVLSESDRQAFLAHETAHYCRRDHWVRWLEWIVTATYWWFPGVYIARRQLERNEEVCCDAWAVRQLGTTPRHYAEALLRVVDFISEHRVGLPRLASGMQPTESLEERLRLVMQSGGAVQTSRSLWWGAGLASVSLWLLHPVPLATRPSVANAAVIVSRPPMQLASIDDSSAAGLKSSGILEANLPEAPSGFWNQAPNPRWANFSLALPGARLIAESNRGISIEILGRESIRFSSEDLSALVEIPSTKRVVIGDRAGQLRLWDLDAGMPVSLIGRHSGAVTSVTYHESSGLVSSDDGGSVMRWDLQSGQVRATWSAAAHAGIYLITGDPPSIQSVRFSVDGTSLAILTGDWNDIDARQRLHIVDSRDFTMIDSLEVAPGTALIQQLPEWGWVSIDWSGVVRSIETQAMITTIEKHQVSALALLHQPSQITTLQLLN